MKILQLLIGLLISTQVGFTLAQSINLNYRGIAIDQNYLDGIKVLKKEFQTYKETETSSEVLNRFGAKQLIAGDAVGMKNESCGLDEGKDCYVIKISSTNKNLGEKIYLIKVEKGFKVPIQQEHLLSGLKEKYGPPRLVFASDTSSTFIWGGIKTPEKSFRAIGSVNKNIDAIDGKFITVMFYTDKTKIPGYHLTVVDSDLWRKNSLALQKSSEEYLKKQATENKVKF